MHRQCPRGGSHGRSWLLQLGCLHTRVAADLARLQLVSAGASLCPCSWYLSWRRWGYMLRWLLLLSGRCRLLLCSPGASRPHCCGQCCSCRRLLDWHLLRDL